MRSRQKVIGRNRSRNNYPRLSLIGLGVHHQRFLSALKPSEVQAHKTSLKNFKTPQIIIHICTSILSLKLVDWTSAPFYIRSTISKRPSLHCLRVRSGRNFTQAPVSETSPQSSLSSWKGIHSVTSLQHIVTKHNLVPLILFDSIKHIKMAYNRTFNPDSLPA